MAMEPVGNDWLSEGFGHFVTAMTAPVASDRSDHRVGLAPPGKAPPYHGAHPERSFGIDDSNGPMRPGSPEQVLGR